MMLMNHLISALDTSSCTHGAIKLWSAYSFTPDDEGIVLICYYGTWYPIYQYSCRVPEIACNVNYLRLKCESNYYNSMVSQRTIYDSSYKLCRYYIKCW